MTDSSHLSLHLLHHTVPDFLLPPPIDAWTPDLGIIAAQRHDPLLRFVIENVFFDQGPLDALSSSSPAVG